MKQTYKIYKIIAPIVFVIIVTNSFTKNMEFPIAKFLVSTVGASSIYNILLLIKKEFLFPYFIGLSIIFLLTISYLENYLYTEFILGLVIVLIWFLTKKYLNNFKLYNR